MLGPTTWLTTMRLQGIDSLRRARMRRADSFTPSTVGMVAMMNCGGRAGGAGRQAASPLGVGKQRAHFRAAWFATAS